MATNQDMMDQQVEEISPSGVKRQLGYQEQSQSQGTVNKSPSRGIRTSSKKGAQAYYDE